MPSLRQIDPIEIPKLLPIILIADILPATVTMRCWERIRPTPMDAKRAAAM